MLKTAYDFEEMSMYGRSKFQECNDIFEFLMYYFIGEVEKLFQLGVFKDYIGFQDNLKFKRGKINFPEHIRRNIFDHSKIFCEYDEMTIDNIENQIIRYTTHILRFMTNNSDIKKRLSKLEVVLDEAELREISIIDFDSIHYSRLSQRYKRVHDICRLFLESKTIENIQGRIGFSSFLMDMNNLFERFVLKLIKRQFPRFKIFYNRREYSRIKKERPEQLYVTLKPDILMLKRGKQELVLDTKYKNAYSRDSRGIESLRNSDIFQIISYSASYNCPGILIYPQNEDELNEGYKIENDDGKILDFRIVSINLNTPKKDIGKELFQIMQDLYLN